MRFERWFFMLIFSTLNFNQNKFVEDTDVNKYNLSDIYLIEKVRRLVRKERKPEYEVRIFINSGNEDTRCVITIIFSTIRNVESLIYLLHVDPSKIKEVLWIINSIILPWLNKRYHMNNKIIKSQHKGQLNKYIDLINCLGKGLQNNDKKLWIGIREKR